MVKQSPVPMALPSGSNRVISAGTADEELYTVAFRYGKEEFECRSLILLTPEQRIKIAKELYYKYNASHKQIRRILKLDQSIISELLPQK